MDQAFNENILVAMKLAKDSLQTMNDFLEIGDSAKASKFAMQATWALNEINMLLKAKGIGNE